MNNNLLQYAPDKKIQNYVFSFKAKLGKGAYGTVYLGKHEKTRDQIVALKVIDKKILSSEYAQHLINQEIEIMKKTDNEYIVKLIDVLHSINNTYIITEYCDGGDLREYLKKKRILSQEEAVKIFRNILQGLKDLIGVGIIHRDIKPANILINDGTFKLTDFGFAREVSNHQNSVMNSLVGTPLYMSPQILKRQTYTSKCDIWSLGLIFYEMLYGQTPWHSSNLVELMAKLENKPLVFPSQPVVSDQIKELIKCCLQISEDKRITWEALFSHPLVQLKPKPIEIPPFTGLTQIMSNTSTLLQMQSQRQRELTHHRVRTEAHNKEHSRERSNSNLERFRSNEIQQTPPIVKNHHLKNTDSVTTPSALNSNSTNTTGSSNRPRIMAQFEINFKTNQSRVSEFTTGNLDYDFRNDKRRPLFKEIKNQDPRMKRTSSLNNRVNYVNTPQSNSKQMVQYVRVIQNQLDLIPNHVGLKKDIQELSDNIKLKLVKERPFNRDDSQKIKQLVNNLSNFSENNQNDHFLVQVQVMYLLMSLLSNIVSTNQQLSHLMLNQTQQDKLKRLQDVQQQQLTISPGEISKEIKYFLQLNA